MKFLLALALLMPVAAIAAIGNITELQGSMVDVKRGKDTLTGKSNGSIESMDTVVVGSKTNLAITFVDNTKVRITENSRLLIDDFVYDAKKSDAGKLAMKVALGTVRYASGQIAKNNQQNVDIKTPTSTIAVRGTDFAMTVDEMGRSLIVLLPSCKEEEQLKKFELIGGCTVGAIDVSTDAGMVSLTQPFTATLVRDANEPPLKPVKIDGSINNIGNSNILKLPTAVAEAAKEEDDKKKNSKEPGNKLSEEELRRRLDEEMSRKSTSSSTTILVKEEPVVVKQIDAANPCAPFDTCGNEKGSNWYERIDPERGNVIRVKSGERLDNVTYQISVNSTELETKIVGDGSTKITIRQWNK